LIWRECLIERLYFPNFAAKRLQLGKHMVERRVNFINFVQHVLNIWRAGVN